MADFNSASLRLVRYEPGNPEFPTLPDGVTSLHFVGPSILAGLTIERDIEVFLGFDAAPSTDDQRFSGWHTDDTWFNPTQLALGVISQPLVRTVNVHNTRRTAISVTNIITPVGITLSSPTPPTVVPSFESIVFSFDISAVGPGQFEDVITIQTTEGDFNIVVSGTRVDIFEFVPDLPFSETLKMKTEIKRSKDGTDQTISLVKSVTSAFDFRVAQDDDVTRSQLRNQIIAGNSQLLASCLKWHEARYIANALTATDTVLPVDTTNTSYAPGDNVSIVDLAGNFLVRSQILSLTPSSVTLDAALGVNIPRNCVIVPFANGYINRFPQYNVYPVNAEDMRIEFVINDEPWLGAALPGSFNLLNGRPLLEKPNKMSGRTKQIRAERAQDVLDSRLMNRAAFNKFPFTDEFKEYRAVLNGASEIWDWRVLFHYLNGSWGTFYVPTYQDDIPGTTTTTSTDFVAPDIGLERLFGNAPPEPRKYLRFLYPDGTIIYTSITNVVDGGTMSVADVLIDGNPIISFVELSRIVGDTATLEFRDRIQQAEMVFRYRTVTE